MKNEIHNFGHLDMETSFMKFKDVYLGEKWKIV